MNISSHLLGDILVSMKIISRSQLEKALEYQHDFFADKMDLPHRKGPEFVSESRIARSQVPLLGQILVQKGIITEDQLSPALNLQVKRANELSSLDSKKLATALELGFIINSTVNFVDVLSLIMKYANLVTDSMASTLMLRDEQSGELVFSVPTGPNADELKDIRIPQGAGIAGWVAQNEEYVMVNDTDTDPRFYSGVDTLTGQKTRSLLCVPMKSKWRLIGVLEVLNKKHGELFTIEDAHLLTIFAHQAAIAIENATLFSSLQEQLKKEKQLMTEFAASERVRAIGSFAGGIAHDFNNILGIIMGNTELALGDCRDPEMRKTLGIIYDQTLRGKNLTKNLVAFAQTQDIKQEYFDISDSINHVLDLMRKDLDGVELVRNYGCNVPEVLGDPGMMEHLFVNLIQNSLHAMSRTADPRLFITTFFQDGCICAEIEDNGCGIPEEHRNAIYEPSFSLKGGRDVYGSYRGDIKGSGFGMSNVKKYLEQHKGSISFDSAIGKYTKFRIRLPFIEKEISKQDLKEFDGAVSQTGRTILLVEDEKPIAELQCRMLSHPPFSHTVHVAYTGRMALDALASSTYDLVSLDYVLPGGLSGMDVYAEIRKINPTLPILFVSGNIDFLESIRDLKLQDNYIDHLSKPCRQKDYLEAVSRLLERP